MFFSFCKTRHVPSILCTRRGIPRVCLTLNYWQPTAQIPAASEACGSVRCAVYTSQANAAALRLSLPLPQVYSWLNGYGLNQVLLPIPLLVSKIVLSCDQHRTLYFSQSMGEDPRSMHSHVMSTMFSHARCYNILGPIFLQIKLAMSPYWSQPQSLKFLCRSVIRKTIIKEPGRFINNDSVSSLMLPPSLQSYLMLES